MASVRPSGFSVLEALGASKEIREKRAPGAASLPGFVRSGDPSGDERARILRCAKKSEREKFDAETIQLNSAGQDA
jgi:hypothetical protein